MIRQRSDDQVRTAAAQMDQALAGELPAEQLVALTAARRIWHDTGQLPAASPDLVSALNQPAAETWDSVFVKAARRELSGPSRSVRS